MQPRVGVLPGVQGVFARALGAAAGVCAIAWTATRGDPEVALAAGGVLLALLLSYRPNVLYYATIAVFFVNPALVPPVAEVGAFKVRIADILFALLVGRLLLHLAAAGLSLRLPSVFLPVGAALALVGAGVGALYYYRPGVAGASLASYLRLFETSLLLPISYLLFDKEAAFRAAARFFIVAAGTSILLAALLWFADDSANWRAEGLLGVNSLGLVSGLLLLTGALAPTSGVRWTVVPLALWGLWMTKSAGSMIATMTCLGLLLAGRKLSIRAVVVTALVPLVIVAGITLTRWEDAAGVLELSGGSFAHRLYLANVALRLFSENPVMGVGWQASASAEVVGDAAINADLHSRYWKLPNYLFADVNPTSVHNMYLQILVELGAAGAILIAAIALTLRRESHRVRESVAGSPWARIYSRFLPLGLLFIAIWWNSNPLYPGQIETVLFMAFAGLLPALPSAAGVCGNAQGAPVGWERHHG